MCFLVVNVSWGGDTLVEGVEHVEGFWIRMWKDKPPS